jgi:type IV pilus assembly protein PilA
MISNAMKRLHDRRESAVDAGEDAGFTLIELMVVLLILAILLAIAIPTFLGVTKSANDRAAQSNLNTALVNAKAAFQSNSQSYGIGSTSTLFPTALAGSLSSAEPSLSFLAASTNAGTSTGQSAISVFVPTDGNGVILAAQAKGTSNCWYMIDNSQAEAATAGTGYANVPSAALAAGTWYGEAKNNTAVPTCNADAIPATSTASPVAFQSNGFPNE